MASMTMPPPPTPFAHRRTHRLITKNLPPSPPASPESSACVLSKMSLSKGATFHCSSSPSKEDDPVLSIPHLTRRSPTCSQSMLTSWLSEKEDVAKSLADFEQTFSGARGKRTAGRRRSAQNFEQVWVRRAALPSDEGLGSSISPASDKNLAQSFHRALDLLSNKDSALGSSIKSDSVGRVVVGNTSEEDGLVQDLIQEADSSDLTSRRLRQRASHPSTRSSSTIAPSAVTESIAPRPSRPTLRHPPLSRSARNKLKEYIISPILEEARFQNLHPFVTALDSKTNKSIRCLRDLEQSLIFQPLTFAISRHLYRAFGEFTIQLVVDAYQHLSESEQRRAADRPYDNGYFLDLVQQVHRLASHIGSSGRAQQAGTAEEDDEMAYSIDDEVTLEGGLGETGNQAELVRWKNGNGFSLRTGLPYEPTPGIKRQSSGALDEDVARSMARRKKGYIPEYVEMKCSDPSCDKVFTRKCDLAKHEKTHSRPFKCPEEGCKYHELGLPTEKERERHFNDKHSKDPQFYKCDYCEFRTKRESNCKQHMEKKHGWHYERAKGKDKAPAGSTRMTPAQTPQTPSIDFSASPAISTSHHSNWDDASSIAGSIGGSIAGSAALTPYEQPLSNFDSFNPAPVSYSNPIFPRTTPAMLYNQMADDFDFNAIPFNQNYQPAQAYVSPITTSSMSAHNMMGTPITPAYSNITEPSPYDTLMDVTMDCTNPTVWNEGLPTPSSFLQPQSRNPSISEHSPMIAGPSGHTFDKASMMGQDMEFPSGDFSLFGGEGSNAFSNPAAASATLFPGGPEAFATLDNDPMFSEAFNDDDLFDWDMTN
ncbi:hypothetical protein, variant 3 [Exophiala xenobiotica]|uniref:C2H2-type domain-containing protein n=1 Tax=Exophiala xenobiotica TaxID=348802 RepID=A0A0D2D1C7_9EURO|nr:hypothetical protein, variant 2 [Exophiala xenobiotica]XP_013316812.1 hypothetical protein, variant 3 [Exophiala xenobiotica]KIW56227.1 hypothetical protein, variant 2 [Exophiala xenobiotica]KIW56228.1 hypothetical protein, variant 3 [Exophiala xenobiotica]